MIALSARLAFVFLYSPTALSGRDGQAYWSFAKGIISGQGYHSAMEPEKAYRPPLYPYFVAAILCFLSEDHISVFAVQAFFGAIACSLLYLCATKLMNPGRGLFAGLLFALFPHFLLFTKQLLTESLYIDLLIVLFACILLPLPQQLIGVRSITFGVVWGLMTLLRFESLITVATIFVIFAATIQNSTGKYSPRAIVLVISSLIVTITPWLIHTWLVVGYPTLSTSGGVNLFIGNNPDANGGYIVPQKLVSLLARTNEVVRSAECFRMSVDWVWNHPGGFMALLPKKFGTLWGSSHNLFLDGTDCALFMLCTLGVWRVLRSNASWKAVLGLGLSMAISASVISLVFFGMWRYRISAYPGLILLAAYGLPDWTLRLKRRSQGHECP